MEHLPQLRRLMDEANRSFQHTPQGQPIAEALTVAFDLETTGLAEDDAIVQIAMAQIKPGGRIEPVLASLVNPGMPIPAEASAIHGITDARVADSPAFFEMARDVALVLSGADLIVGYNVLGFDWPFIIREFAASGVTCGPPRSSIAGGAPAIVDPLVFARYAWPGQSCKLSDLCQRLGIPFSGEAHEAAADIDATLQLFIGMVERGLIPPTIEGAVVAQAALVRFQKAAREAFGQWLTLDRDGRVVHATGKVKGLTLEVAAVRGEASYLRWIHDKSAGLPGVVEAIREFQEGRR